MMTPSYLYRRVADLYYGIHFRDVQSNSGHRASTSSSSILLISFNMASAALLVATILFDAWRLSRKNVSIQADKRCRILHLIRPGEFVTLSISIAILIQGLVFLVILSVEMNASNCAALGEILFPALWIVGFVILVFGIETLYRGFQRVRFAPPKKGRFYICWAAALFLVLMLWIPTQARRSTLDMCSLGLLSLATPWNDVAFGTSIAFIVSYILIASVLTTQLFRTPNVNPMGRIAASQMVYYLAIASIVFILFLPFWAKCILDIPRGITFMMAMMSLNVIGIAISLFHLLFRSYTNRMTIRYSEPLRNLREWRFFGSMKTEIKKKISSPIVIQQDEPPFFDSTHTPTPGSANTMNIDKSLPPTPTINKYSSQKDVNSSKGHYSIFPTKLSTRRVKYPASSIYEDDDIFLAPPRPPFAASHNRNSSDVSHATVQIGFRLSNLDPPITPHEPTSSSSLLSPGHLYPSQASWAQDALNHISTTSLDVPVTLRSPAVIEQRPTDSFPPSRLRSSTMPSYSTSPVSIGTFHKDNSPSPIPSPAVYRKLDDLKKLLDVDLKAAQQAAAASQNDPWPLRDSLPILLPKKTYNPDESDQG